MREILYGAMAAVILWAVIDQWRRNRDTVRTLAVTLVIGAVVLALLIMIWQKATTGRVQWPLSL